MADIAEALGGQRLTLQCRGPVLLALQLRTSGKGGLDSPKEPQNWFSGPGCSLQRSEANYDQVNVPERAMALHDC